MEKCIILVNRLKMYKAMRISAKKKMQLSLTPITYKNYFILNIYVSRDYRYNDLKSNSD